MGEASEPARRLRRAKEDAPQLVIDPDRIALDPERIVVKHTEDGGYFCLGLGRSAEFLRMLDFENADEPVDVARSAIAKTEAPLLRSSDPFLRRLGTAVALAKDYDPDQPRDEDGRWTSEGGGAGAAAAFLSRPSVVEPPLLVPALRALASRLLSSGLIGPVGGAVAFFGTIFIPTNQSLISEGTVSGAPDLSYRFDQGTGVLSLARNNEDGTKDDLFYGRYGLDGLFRDKEGNVIGRHIGDSIVVDAATVPGYRARAKSKDQSDADAGARTDAVADTDDPKLCPDKTTEDIRGRKEPALRYQEQITGIPPGLDFKLIDPLTKREVSYDGCIPETGTMQEAKGPGYQKQMTDPESWEEWYTGVEDIKNQMERQSRAAGPRLVEWHFAEERVANYFRQYAISKGYPNIIVIWTPAK